MPTVSDDRCDTCQYFAGQPDQDGECRRRPPIVSNRPTRVRPEYWCGEFERIILSKEERRIQLQAEIDKLLWRRMSNDVV